MCIRDRVPGHHAADILHSRPAKDLQHWLARGSLGLSIVRIPDDASFPDQVAPAVMAGIIVLGLHLGNLLPGLDVYKRQMEHCWEYGFILRYPPDKEEKTGIIYEPWHYRYVGREYAQAIRQSGLCLEEFLQR